ncbi:glycosyl transferase family 90-domain-containing protein [Mycena alexandri]|uniref:Glycosyl transferase family 90-domain-containing protein n=1 Tax=Mycena alexandri TaxID=1745969 RepID=A0AAD6TBT2_9AGAR|nr:glycosyl transferase family 90-domain-containing protein [Mycena alexandri]
MSTHTHNREDSSSQLLPSYRRHKDEENSYFSIHPLSRTSCRYWMPFVSALTLVGMFSGVVYIPSHHKPWHNSSTDVNTTHERPLHIPTTSPELIAQHSIDELYGRQSHTLEEAAARYTLKYGRVPPPNYDKWFRFAQDSHCLIDDYDRIHRDFEPFYQLAREHPNRFQNMIDNGRSMMLKDPRGMMTMSIRQGEVQLPAYSSTSFDGDLQAIVQQFAHILPDMEFLLNGRDEPRVVFNVGAAGAQEDAMRLKDPNPFHIAPVPTADFFRQQSGCDISSTPSGFVLNPVDDIAFLSSSSNSDFTTDLWPLLSMTKISPCFSDILFPSVSYYDQSSLSGKFAHTNDFVWEDKKPILYWRGTSNGGHIYGQNYRHFPRFRLIELARNHSELIDARMTAFAETLCTTDCDRDGIIEEYNIEGPPAPKEEVYRFKYLLDVDGNTFSGRYLDLLRSGSLVFKSTAFEEYFSDWLRPYEHYIPVRPDLSDLAAKVEWARQNDAEARVIQARGMEFAQRVISDKQNSCYFSAVLLEWAQLQSLALNETGNTAR